MKRMHSRNSRFLGSVVLAVGVGGIGIAPEAIGQVSCPGEIAGSTCVCDDQASDITICVDWGAGADVIVRGGTGAVNVKIPAITGGVTPSIIQFGNPGGIDCALAGNLTLFGGIGQNAFVQVFGSLAGGGLTVQCKVLS